VFSNQIIQQEIPIRYTIGIDKERQVSYTHKLDILLVCVWSYKIYLFNVNI